MRACKLHIICKSKQNQWKPTNWCFVFCVTTEKRRNLAKLANFYFPLAFYLVFFSHLAKAGWKIAVSNGIVHTNQHGSWCALARLYPLIMISIIINSVRVRVTRISNRKFFFISNRMHWAKIICFVALEFHFRDHYRLCMNSSLQMHLHVYRLWCVFCVEWIFALGW